MLTLSRQVGERIMIGENIVITVVGISRNGYRVKIGVEAPREIPVYREELLDLIRGDSTPEKPQE